MPNFRQLTVLVLAYWLMICGSLVAKMVTVSQGCESQSLDVSFCEHHYHGLH